MVGQEKRSVFITGCSDGGLGAGLALELHKRGLRVLASARNPSKMSSVQAAGIETFELDVLDDASIRACVSQVSSVMNGKLDILINNAGGGYNMPISDMSISEAKKLFDLNVWSYITVTQAFLPLLIESAKSSKGSAMVVNNTSISSLDLTPFNSVYHASKAAAAMFSDHQRLEFAPFNIKVIDLKTGSVKTNFHANRADPSKIPSGSLYEPIREEAQATMTGSFYIPTSMPLEEWAKDVVDDLLKRDPPPYVWRGRQAGKAWWQWTFGPTVTWFDHQMKEASGLNKLAKLLGRST